MGDIIDFSAYHPRLKLIHIRHRQQPRSPMPVVDLLAFRNYKLKQTVLTSLSMIKQRIRERQTVKAIRFAGTATIPAAGAAWINIYDVSPIVSDTTLHSIFVGAALLGGAVTHVCQRRVRALDLIIPILTAKYFYQTHGDEISTRCLANDIIASRTPPGTRRLVRLAGDLLDHFPYRTPFRSARPASALQQEQIRKQYGRNKPKQ